MARCLRKLGVRQEISIDSEGRERFHPYDVQRHYNGVFNSWIQWAAVNPLKKVCFYF
jgi:hypothetical protein